MSNVEKKGTEELISKDNEGLGGYYHIWAEFYEENAVYNFFLFRDRTNSQRGII